MTRVARVQVFSLNGQRVLQAAQTDIDVSALPQGMYILRAETTDGNAHQCSKYISRGNDIFSFSYGLSKDYEDISQETP